MGIHRLQTLVGHHMAHLLHPRLLHLHRLQTVAGHHLFHLHHEDTGKKYYFYSKLHITKQYFYRLDPKLTIQYLP